MGIRLALVPIILAAGCTPPEPEAETGPSGRVPIEKQIERLARFGLIVNPGVGEDELTMFDDRHTLESVPYQGLVDVLGMDIGEEPFTPLCNQLWMCDYERIEDHGAYKEVLRRLETMTGRALLLENIADHVDIEAGVAWVEYDRGGTRVRWDLEVDGDWLDPSILVRYDRLLAQTGAAVRIYSNHTDYGQVAFLAALRPEQKQEFDALVRVRLTPLPPE